MISKIQIKLHFSKFNLSEMASLSDFLWLHFPATFMEFENDWTRIGRVTKIILKLYEPSSFKSIYINDIKRIRGPKRRKDDR